MENRLERLQRQINHWFHDQDLLKMALTHRSFAYEKKGVKSVNNERLEFLGDAILDLVISEYLYCTYPHLSEGAMTKLKAIVVSSKSLFAKAYELGLGEYLLLGRGEDLTGGRSRSSLLADVLEALIGAIYLDQGLEEARSFILEHLSGDIQNLYEGNQIKDYKTELQELIQGKKGMIPSYLTIKELGPDHKKEFVVQVMLEETVIGQGQGRSKKEAEQMAAQEAWESMKKREAEG